MDIIRNAILEILGSATTPMTWDGIISELRNNSDVYKRTTPRERTVTWRDMKGNKEVIHVGSRGGLKTYELPIILSEEEVVLRIINDQA